MTAMSIGRALFKQRLVLDFFFLRKTSCYTKMYLEWSYF